MRLKVSIMLRIRARENACQRRADGKQQHDAKHLEREVRETVLPRVLNQDEDADGDGDGGEAQRDPKGPLERFIGELEQESLRDGTDERYKHLGKALCFRARDGSGGGEGEGSERRAVYEECEESEVGTHGPRKPHATTASDLLRSHSS